MSAITTPDRSVSSVSLTGEARLAQLASMKVARERKDKLIEAVLLLAADDNARERGGESHGGDRGFRHGRIIDARIPDGYNVGLEGILRTCI